MSRIKKLLICKTPNWTALAKIQRFKVVKTMYVWLFIVPVAAKMLEKVNDAAGVTVWGYSFELQMGLPFSWKMFYMCSVCFVLANLISRFRCYKLIRDHVNYSDFIQAGKTIDQLQEYACEYSVCHGVGDSSSLSDPGKLQKFGEDLLKSEYWYLVKCMDSHREYSRLCCFLFYAAGFLLLLVVFLQNFEYVASVMF